MITTETKCEFTNETFCQLLEEMYSVCRKHNAKPYHNGLSVKQVIHEGNLGIQFIDTFALAMKTTERNVELFIYIMPLMEEWYDLNKNDDLENKVKAIALRNGYY